MLKCSVCVSVCTSVHETLFPEPARNIKKSEDTPLAYFWWLCNYQTSEYAEAMWEKYIWNQHQMLSAEGERERRKAEKKTCILPLFDWSECVVMIRQQSWNWHHTLQQPFITTEQHPHPFSTEGNSDSVFILFLYWIIVIFSICLYNNDALSVWFKYLMGTYTLVWGGKNNELKAFQPFFLTVSVRMCVFFPTDVISLFPSFQPERSVIHILIQQLAQFCIISHKLWNETYL